MSKCVKRVTTGEKFVFQICIYFSGVLKAFYEDKVSGKENYAWENTQEPVYFVLKTRYTRQELACASCFYVVCVFLNYPLLPVYGKG